LTYQIDCPCNLDGMTPPKTVGLVQAYDQRRSVTAMHAVGQTYSIGNLALSWGLYFNTQKEATHIDLEAIAFFLGDSLEHQDRHSELIAVSCHQMTLLDFGQSLCQSECWLRAYAGLKSQVTRNLRGIIIIASHRCCGFGLLFRNSNLDLLMLQHHWWRWINDRPIIWAATFGSTNIRPSTPLAFCRCWRPM